MLLDTFQGYAHGSITPQPWMRDAEADGACKEIEKPTLKARDARVSDGEVRPRRRFVAYDI